MNSFDFGQVNPAQREAVLQTEGPVLMIAGPGTGKTYTLVKRIAYLVRVKGVSPNEVMVVTFTEKAGKELLTRISNELIDHPININEMYIGTFHSVCLRLMKEHSDAVEGGRTGRMLDAFEQTYLVCRNIDDFNRLGEYARHISGKSPWNQALEICRYVNQMMEELVDIDAMEQDADPDMRFLGKLVKRYQVLLDRNGAMDFSSIQTKAYNMFKRHPEVLSDIQSQIKYLMVDEYQDTNYIQEQIIFLLAGERKNLCVVGDDDQGLYRFRGATIRNILEFPSKFGEEECKVIHLNTNYRSEPGIIDFDNRWMENTGGGDLFHWDRYRYPKSIEAGKSPTRISESVFSCGGDSIGDESRELLMMVKSLLINGNIHNYNQVAFLFRSVKSEEAVQIGAYFEQNGIPVYSPRSDMFFDRLEVKQILGCIMLCFQSYIVDLKDNRFHHGISQSVRDFYKSCLQAAYTLAKANPGMMVYVEKTRQWILTLKEESKVTLLDIYYRILAFPPFTEYLQADLNANILLSRAARNLAEVSRMLSRFSFLHDMYHITCQNKLSMPEELFNIYLNYMLEDGIGEYEDESEYAPSGCISFMTIHQSKGLEFPVVVVGSLGNAPRRNRDPLLLSAETRFFHRKPYEPLADIKFFDFWRLYYTAFSRAQNLLILATRRGASKYFDQYISRVPDFHHFHEKVLFSDIKAIRYKHVYSFTSHISIYEGCPDQYKYFKEYGFAQNKMVHTSIGTLVHETLEDIHRCIIAGMADRVNEAAIKEWFTLNDQKAQERTGYHLTDEQRDQALQQVLRYYHNRKDELGNVWKAEEEINLVLPDYILKGVIDLIEGYGDSVEIVDYKTGPKPDIKTYPESVENYRKQLEIYAYLIEKQYGKKISRIHLYYTNCPDNDPLITFEWSRDAIDATIAEVSATIRNIEDKRFGNKTAKLYVCALCDMRYVCGKTSVE